MTDDAARPRPIGRSHVIGLANNRTGARLGAVPAAICTMHPIRLLQARHGRKSVDANPSCRGRLLPKDALPLTEPDAQVKSEAESGISA